MLKNLLKKRKESGFTIIEVVIVLAIAGLILVVVLVAIPQLQRNQRNTARRNDVSRVGTSVSNWMSNNNGQAFPTTAPASTAAIGVVASDLGNLSQYDSLTTNITTAAGAATVANSLTINQIRIVVGAKCSTSGAATNTGATSRQIALQYATENNSNSPVPQCLDI